MNGLQLHLRSLACVTVVLTAAVAPGTEPFVLESPNGQTRVTLFGDDDQLRVGVEMRDRVILEPSPLHFDVDGQRLTAGATYRVEEQQEIDETYPWRGVHSTAVHRGRGAVLEVQHAASDTTYQLHLRAYDDAVAYRLMVPGADDASRVPAEASEFRLPAGSTVWLHGMNGHYEAEHDEHQIDELPADTWAAPPLTYKLTDNGGYASITEAALLNYSGMALQATGNRTFRLVLGPDHPVSRPFRLRYEDEIEAMSQPAAVTGTITTPWRLVMVGDDLNQLVNCDAVHNLGPPADPQLFPQGVDTSWVKPGRAVWRYLDGGDRSLDGMKQFASMAGELGFEYNILEAFWERYDTEEIRELVDHSREQGVGLWFWKHSNELRTPEAQEEFFKNLHEWGVVGAKIDFFDHEHKDVVDRYTNLLRTAAKYQILVNFHGANKPTGEARTWPNELVREGVRGMESRGVRNRARHDATVPFTRYLAGHADYTSTHFGQRRGNTTWTHQIATSAVFTSPLLTYAAHPESLLENPAVEMIKSIPATWDETRVLAPSEVGQLAVFARRTGDTWFLAVVNGPEPRELEVPLSFLPKGEYACRIVRDDLNDPAAVELDQVQCTRDDTASMRLLEGGGFIARFEPTAVVATTELPSQ